MSGRTRGNGQETVQPDWCSDEMWEALPPSLQRTVPATVQDLAERWNTLERARDLVGTLFLKSKLPAGHRATRVSLVESRDREPTYLAIVDAESKQTDYSLFHKGPSAFGAFVMACWRALQEDADWRIRQRGRTGSQNASEAPSGLSSL